MAEAALAQPKQAAEVESRAKWRLKPPVLIGMVAGAVVLGVLVVLLLGLGKESTDDAQVDADVVPLGLRVGGQVLKVAVAENQHVKQGDLILQLDDSDYLAKVQQSQAELDSTSAQADAADAQAAVAVAGAHGGLSQAEASLTGTNRAVSNARAQVEQARATLISRQADLKLAETNVQRARLLLKDNAIPQQQADQYFATYSSAKAGVDAAQASVTASEEQLLRTQSQVTEAEGRLVVTRPVDALIAAAQANAAYQHARVKSAEAVLTLANLNLAWTRLLSPGDGIVSRLTAYPGAIVSAGQTVASFVPDKKYIVANFKETQVAKMHPGQRADVSIDGTGKTLSGKVESLAGGTGSRFSLLPPDNATGNFVKITQRIPVRIALDSVPAGLDLRAGQSVEATVHVNE
ncbi:MAG: HlyD family secretion protein [Myxococcaceae bacterium]